MVCADGPTVSGSVKVPCTEPHEWRAVTTISIGDEDEKYPGDRVVEVTTRDYCSESVGAWLNYRSTTTSATRGSTRPSGRRATAGRCAGRRPTCDQARAACSWLALLALAGCCGERRAGGPADAVGVRLPARRTPTAAVPPPAPPDRACYQLSYDEALAPTSTAEPVDCARAAHALTFFVGDLDRPSTAICWPSTPTSCRSRSPSSARARLDGVHRRQHRGPPAEHAAAGLVHPHGRGVRRRRRLVPLRRRRPRRGRRAGAAHGRIAGVLDTPAGRDRYAHVRHRRARDARTSTG